MYNGTIYTIETRCSILASIQNPTSNHLGRQFYYAIQNRELPNAADYLTEMVRRHVFLHPDNDEALQVFMSAHLVSAFDLAGYLKIDQLEPLESILRSEILRYREEYVRYNDPVSLMVHHIIHKVTALCGLEVPHASGRMDQVKGYIDIYYSDPELNVSDLSVRFDVSLSYLSRTFKKATGQGINDYIHQVRIANAKTLLAETKMSISQIAQKVGFTSSNAFIRAYRNQEGIPPGAYRSHIQQLKDHHN